jgi:hypothetical protein
VPVALAPVVVSAALAGRIWVVLSERSEAHSTAAALEGLRLSTGVVALVEMVERR